MRNPFRRQVETVAPTLHERADALRGSLSRRDAVLGAAVAAAVPLSAVAAQQINSTELASACDAATAHLDWINNVGARDSWPDDRLSRELERIDDVLWRVADEASTGLDDLSAKARLLLASDSQHLGLSDHAGDRATLTLLREVTALTPARKLPPLPTLPPVERADLYDRLLTLYAEDHNARPARDNPETERAAELVASRLWEAARAVADLPAPKTLDGLRTTALAAAIIHEFALCGGTDMNDCAAVGLIRATLAVTGTPLPPGFVGFGDEPDFSEREQASMNQRHSAVPAWAVAEIEAENAANA